MIIKSALLTLLTAFSVTNVVQSAILRVNPVPGRAEFTSLQAAIDAANPGDAIYVDGGLYEDVVISKSGLSIFGPGFNLSANDAAQGVNEAVIASLKIGRTASNLPPVSDIFMSGIHFSDSTIAIAGSNLTFKRCKFIGIRSGVNDVLGGAGEGSSNLVFIGCQITGRIATGGVAVSNLVFDSCIIHEYDSDLATNVSVRNCIIESAPSSADSLDSSAFVNCIIYPVGTQFFTNSSVTNSVAIGSNFPNNVNVGSNVNGASESEVFSFEGSSDGKYQLVENSVAAGIGPNGEDAGIFGRGQYVLGGLPALPTIISIDLPDTVSSQQDLTFPITIDVIE